MEILPGGNHVLVAQGMGRSVYDVFRKRKATPRRRGLPCLLSVYCTVTAIVELIPPVPEIVTV
jgi:hypothetical protein